MNLPEFALQAGPQSAELAFDEAELNRRAYEIVEEAVVDPAEGAALLRAAALLMAYLAAHEDEPARGAAILIAEMSGNLHTILHRMTAIQAGSA